MSAAPALPIAPAPQRGRLKPAAPLIADAVAHLLSPSQVSTWLDCPARWYYHYALGIPEPRTAALALGESLHFVTAAILRIRAADNWESNVEDPYEIIETHLRGQLAGAVLEEDDNEEDLVQKAKAMLRLWIEQVLPAIAEQPAGIEFRMEGFIGPVRVQGTADVITADRMIVDLKTASKKPAGVRDSHMLQLATYAMLADRAAATAAGVPPQNRAPEVHTRARLFTIAKTKTPTVTQQTVEITDQDRRYAARVYAEAQAGMRSGMYTPRRCSNLCRRRLCAYADLCEAEYGGRVPE